MCTKGRRLYHRSSLFCICHQLMELNVRKVLCYDISCLDTGHYIMELKDCGVHRRSPSFSLPFATLVVLLQQLLQTVSEARKKQPRLPFTYTTALNISTVLIRIGAVGEQRAQSSTEVCCWFSRGDQIISSNHRCFLNLKESRRGRGGRKS